MTALRGLGSVGIVLASVPRAWNVALAALAAAGLITEGLIRGDGSLAPGAFALAVVAGAPLAWRSSTPMIALAGVEAGAVACALAFDASYVATAMIMVELYTVAVVGHRQRSIVIGAITAIGVIAVIIAVDGTLDLGGVAIRLPLVFLALAAGDVVRTRTALGEAMRERAQREAHEREEEGRRRATEERLRIARELHDTLAHSLVAINVQAAVAIDLHQSPETDALQDIKTASSTALRDLRATLKLLRDQGDTAPTAPTSGLEGVTGLVAQARATGLDATVETLVNGTIVSSAIGGAAFRIVQEALTNVMRHADASAARVLLRSDQVALHIEVTDNGFGTPPDTGLGFGLRGMNERAAALGGEVSAGPRPEGGWRVKATLPLDASEPR
jgi:signal transduction histidine kinase